MQLLGFSILQKLHALQCIMSQYIVKLCYINNWSRVLFSKSPQHKENFTNKKLVGSLMQISVTCNSKLFLNLDNGVIKVVFQSGQDKRDID